MVDDYLAQSIVDRLRYAIMADTLFKYRASLSSTPDSLMWVVS